MDESTTLLRQGLKAPINRQENAQTREPSPYSHEFVWETSADFTQILRPDVTGVVGSKIPKEVWSLDALSCNASAGRVLNCSALLTFDFDF